jgi:hypothetical protein
MSGRKQKEVWRQFEVVSIQSSWIFIRDPSLGEREESKSAALLPVDNTNIAVLT